MDSINFLAKYGIIITNDDILSNNQKTVIVGMSGGVDSSVSAALLHLMGYKVVGIFMKNWNKCMSDDYEDAIRVCCIMGIKDYYHMDLSHDYYSLVFDKFVKDLNLGLTPNPDILCNKHIKFDIFYNFVDLFNADFLATGHYAQIKNGKLYRPFDFKKDQSYFLYDVNPKVWNKVLFPLGSLTKTQVRQIAKDLKLPVSNKKDSTGICFIGNNNYRHFIKDYISGHKGLIRHVNGQILGNHDGLFNFTIGQSKGLGIDFHRKLMVVDKVLSSGDLIVDDVTSPSCFTSSLQIDNLNLNFSSLVRFSNLGALHSCCVKNGIITLNSPIKKIAAGQHAVFYGDNGEVLGGGRVI